MHFHNPEDTASAIRYAVPVSYTHLYSKSRRLEKLIEDLFGFTKLNYGKIAMHIGQIDIVKLLEQLLEEAYPNFEEKNLSYDLQSNVPAKIISADGNLLARLFDLSLVHISDNENAYTTACEVKGPAGGTLDLLAKEDFAIFKALFDFDLSSLAPSSLWSLLADYRPALQESRVFNRRIRDRIVELAKALEQASDLEGFQQAVVEFCRGYGAGTFGLNKAFRILEKEAGGLTVIDPIVNVEHKMCIRDRLW